SFPGARSPSCRWLPSRPRQNTRADSPNREPTTTQSDPCTYLCRTPRRIRGAQTQEPLRQPDQKPQSKCHEACVSSGCPPVNGFANYGLSLSKIELQIQLDEARQQDL